MILCIVTSLTTMRLFLYAFRLAAWPPKTLSFSTCPHPARATRHPIQLLVFYLNQIKFDLSLTNSTLPDVLESTEFHERTDTSCCLLAGADNLPFDLDSEACIGRSSRWRRDRGGGASVFMAGAARGRGGSARPWRRREAMAAASGGDRGDQQGPWPPLTSKFFVYTP
jgi:hypothetical protein